MNIEQELQRAEGLFLEAKKDEALEICENVLKELQEQSQAESPIAAKAYIQKGLLLSAKREHEETLKCFLKAKEIMDASGLDGENVYIDLLESIGVNKMNLGDFQGAKETFADIEGRIEGAALEDPGERLSSLCVQKGNCCDALGSFDESAEEYEKALTILEESGKTQSAAYARAAHFHAESIMLKEEKDYSKAAEVFEKSKQLYEALGMNKSAAYAEMLSGYGLAKLHLGGAYDTAEFFKEAKEILDELEMGYSVAYAKLMTNIGVFFQTAGNFEQALSAYKAAVAVYNALGFEENAMQIFRNIQSLEELQEEEGKGKDEDEAQD